MKPAIRAENLSKCYRLRRGPRGGANLTEALVGGAKAFWNRLRRPAANGTGEDFWALKDVSFDVKPGECVGIIGRNGAGKSTLLKVLSRIAEPTTGRAEVRGRMGSLLEVGTGFHPELTGRENVFLNGSILGMSRAEIRKKFDAIVEFAGVERFLDTPVKRYSSGMYVRLAFAVAVHLEPEILVVDEVLAVGDAGFQQKCFRKMEEVRRAGRTVLVVSHNLGAIQTLCTRALHLERGGVVGDDEPAAEVARYLARLLVASREPLSDRTDREGAGTVRVTSFGYQDGRGSPVESAVCGDELRVVVGCESADADLPVELVALSCWSADGAKLFHVDTAQRGATLTGSGRTREYVCRIPRLPLAPGLYHWNVLVSAGGRMQDHVYSAATLDVLPGDFYRTGQSTPSAGGAVLVDHDWLCPAEGDR
jgi:lipopolysaccharide transport system ATP-binding protein